MQFGNNAFTAIGLFSTCGLMLLALFATWPSVKACQKGRNLAKWYVFSILLFTIALAASFMIKEKRI